MDVLRKHFNVSSSDGVHDHGLVWSYPSTNLRRNEIEQLFVSAGLANIWALLEKNPLLSDYVSDADSKTLEQWLLDLVTYRNDATHGRPDEILGMDSLREWVGFVTSFCGALADIITHRVVQCEINSNPQMVIGIVTERFRNNVAVAKCNSGRLHVGQQLYFFKTDSCIKATIESLQVQNLGIPEIIINEEMEVGIKTSCQVSKNSRIISGYNGFCGYCSTPFMEPETSKFSSQLSA